MKNSIKTTLLALTLTAAFAGPATANISGQTINSAVQSAISSGVVNVSVNDGVATLFGWTDSVYDTNAAMRKALSFNNIQSVVNLINTSD